MYFCANHSTMDGVIIINSEPTSYMLLTDMLPVKIPAQVPYWDMVTFAFGIALVLISSLVALNRRKFSMIMRALYTPRVRSQLMRETKIFDDLIYPFSVTFNCLVQGIFIFLLIENLITNIAEQISPALLLLIAIGAVVIDYFIKMLNIHILTFLFENEEDRNNFYLNKFFYNTLNATLLFPIIVLGFYIENLNILWAYLPFFIANYTMMVYRTLTLNSSRTKFFQFFLYFCTLEILPYLIIVKLLIMI